MSRLRAAYLILANTVLLLFVLSLGASMWATLHDRVWRHSPYADLPEVVKKNYQHMTAAEVDDLLTATWSRPYQYAPWVGFREGALASRFVNVDSFGIRSNRGQPRDLSALDGAVWFLGGSTTFGYGVSDAETIPAQLEGILQSPVVNFGTAYFYSAQENVLMLQYLKSGYRPKAVLFLDGINEACDLDKYQDEMDLLFAKAQREDDGDLGDLAKPWIFGLNTLRRFVHVTRGVVPESRGADPLVCERHGRRIPLHTIHADNLGERDAICRLFNVRCLTVVQPFAGVHGKHEDLSFTEADRRAMREQFRDLENNWRAAHALFVTDALDQSMTHAYVDDVHYSAAASKLIAQAIAARLPGALK